MQLSLNRSIILLFTTGIFIFLGSILPAYLYAGTKDLSIVRNTAYMICCVCSVWVLLDSILSRRRQLTFFCYLFIFFTVLILMHLVIAKNVYNVEGADNDIVGTTYCLFALALGKNLNDIAKYKYFQFLIYLFWCLICYFVFASLDPVSLQAVYGIEDPIFSGAYQYIGDTFAFISILLIFQQLKLIIYLSRKLDTTTKIVIKRVEQARNSLLSLVVICWMLMTWIASNIILFLNSSRASFFSFLILFFYMIYVFFVSYLSNNYVKQNILKLSILILSLGLTTYLYLLLHGQLMSNLTWDTLLSNRNLELLTDGNSSSLEDRNSFYISGIQDILNNPVFGSYIPRVIYRGPGTYMHNIMQIVQDFGIPAFASLLGLIAYCINIFLMSYRSKLDYETMVFNSLLIFSIVQLLFFRNPVGFYAIYINFGIIIRRHLYPEILNNRGHYSQYRLTRFL